MSIAGVHLPTPATDEWWTPVEIFEALEFDFDLDPCAPPEPLAPWIPALNRYSREQDGLSQPWEGRVWLNPPYGKEVGRWLARLAEHGNGIALIFARTDTRWWQESVPSADAVCFIAGRLTFIPGAGQAVSGNSGGPSALIAYGAECAKAVRSCGLGPVYGPPVASREASQLALVNPAGEESSK